MSEKKGRSRSKFVRLIGQVVTRYYAHDVARDSAALTYYLLFAIFPLLIFISVLLGALALGDIGHLFPDTDDRWKGVDSKELLAAVLALPAFRGWSVVNADITIALQAPKLAPHIAQMRRTLAGVMGIGEDRVSVKATTTERLRFVGRREGCEVWAIVLIERK